MFELSGIQIAMVLAIALLVFGPSRLPDLARTIGKGVRDFRQALSGEEHAAQPMHDATQAPAATAAPAPAAAAPAAAAVVPTVIEDDEILDGIVVSGDTAPRHDQAPPA